MNHTYRLVWNDLINAFVAVSELTKGRSKKTATTRRHSRAGGNPGVAGCGELANRINPLKLAVLAAACATSFAQAADPLPATALPTGAQLAAGQASVAQTGARMDITQSSDRAILNWQSFNIGQSAHVNFIQPSAAAVTLNRVVGGDPSQILGRITANGQVFLSNPNGIYFGKNAQIDVASLVATTHNIRDQDFMAGRYDFTIPGKPGASVINEGDIRISDTGIAAFVAPSVANRGVIAAKLSKIQLAAANGFTLDFHGDDLLTFLVDDKVAQTALDQNGQPLASFVESSGRIEAQGGTVWLTAKAAEGAVHSAINHSGVIEATTVETHQGQIILHAGTASLQVSGRLDASAANGGDGGFIETSGAHVTISPEAQITTKAKQGKTGTWLIDPNDYTIAQSGGNITGTQLSTQLANNNVVIQTATMGTPGGTGTIYVDAPISWSSGNSLDFQAEGSVLISANIQGNGWLGVSAHANLFVSPSASVSARHIDYVADNILLQGRTDVTESVYLRPYTNIPVVISNSHVAGSLNISPSEIATLHAPLGGGNIGIGCTRCGNTPLTVSISLDGSLVDAGDLHLVGTSVTVNQPITFGPNQAGLVFESGSGGVRLNAPIATRNTLHFYLNGGIVLQSANAPVSANILVAEGNGSLSLDDASDGNSIDFVAGDVTGSFWVVNNSKSLTVGSFDGVNGVTAGNIGLYTGNDLIVNAPLRATGTGLISALTPTTDPLCTVGPCVRPHIEVGANGRFVNNVGANAISVQPGTYWAIFADNPVTSVINGLTPNAVSYDAELIHGDVLLSANRIFYFNREPATLVQVDLCATNPLACKGPEIIKGNIGDIKDDDELLIMGGTEYNKEDLVKDIEFIVNNVSGMYSDLEAMKKEFVKTGLEYSSVAIKNIISDVAIKPANDVVLLWKKKDIKINSPRDVLPAFKETMDVLVESGLIVAGGTLSSINPATYLKSLQLADIKLLLDNGIISKDEADFAKKSIETAYLVSDLAGIVKSIAKTKKLTEFVNKNNIKFTKDGKVNLAYIKKDYRDIVKNINGEDIRSLLNGTPFLSLESDIYQIYSGASGILQDVNNTSSSEFIGNTTGVGSIDRTGAYKWK